MRLVETRDGLILEVSVKPRAKGFKIVAEGEEIIIHCKEEPVEGKVNKEIIKELSRILHKKVELVSGFSSKQKRLLVRGGEKSEVERILSPQ
jgi:uncharacterized protein (TIGR00251 family)